MISATAPHGVTRPWQDAPPRGTAADARRDDPLSEASRCRQWTGAKRKMDGGPSMRERLLCAWDDRKWRGRSETAVGSPSRQLYCCRANPNPPLGRRPEANRD